MKTNAGLILKIQLPGWEAKASPKRRLSAIVRVCYQWRLCRISSRWLL